MQHQCPCCPRICASYVALCRHIDSSHKEDHGGIARAHADHLARTDAERLAKKPRLAARKDDVRRGAGEPIIPPRPPPPPPFFDDVDLVETFGNIRTFNWWAREELRGTSMEDAPEAISTEQLDTAGADNDLRMDARRGFAPQRKLLEPIVDRLGLKFHERQLTVTLPDGRDVNVTMHYRQLADVASFLYRFVTADDCRPRTLLDPATGERVYADPYTASEIHAQVATLRQRDPSAVLLALKGYADETNVTKNGERTVCPFSVTSLARDLDDVRLRNASSTLLLTYLSKVPASVMVALSNTKKGAVRKALLRAQLRAAFSGVLDTSMVSIIGRRMIGADRVASRVYISMLGLTFDNMMAWSITQTLTNQACFRCHALKRRGDFLKTQSFELRSRQSQMELIGSAWARFPESAAMRKGWLQQFGLHAHPNPCNRVVGLDVYLGTAIPLAHMTYHGMAPKLIECSWRALQVQLPAIDFRRVGERVDAWLVAKATPGGWLKTSFARGFSHFLYGAYIDPLNPWKATVKFGQIASIDVMRDILRVWRVILIDLFEDFEEQLDLFTEYFSFMDLAYRKAHTDSSLALAAHHNQQWKNLAIQIFGKDEFEGMIKFHEGDHVADWTAGRPGPDGRPQGGRGSLLWYNDADGEADHPRFAKYLFTRTNRHKGCEKTMTAEAERRDVLQTLLDVCKRKRADAVAADANLEMHERAPELSTALMGAARVCRLTAAALSGAHPSLRQLPWAIALFLQLSTGGESEADYPNGMPVLTSEQLEIRPGAHVQRWPDDFPQAGRGGAFLHSAFRGGESEGNSLRATNEAPVFVAIDVGGGRIYYAQLILCFLARYGETLQLCYVRWLDTPSSLVRQGLRQAPLPARDTAGPFETYRWSIFPGSHRSGHPPGGGPHYGVVAADSIMYRAPIIASLLDDLGAADPLFRLNDDAYFLSSGS